MIFVYIVLINKTWATAVSYQFKEYLCKSFGKMLSAAPPKTYRCLSNATIV